jgi:hypothetical protein
MQDMKTLNGFEIVDEQARRDNEELRDYASVNIVKDIYGVGFDLETIKAIKDTKIVDNVDITIADAVYDFKGATVNNLNINTTGATIQNATVFNCNVLTGSRNCSFDHVIFKSKTQCVKFAENTWAFNFRECSFIGLEGLKIVAMNAGVNTNTTLILTNCYFYNCAKLIDATGGFDCSIIGGWADEAEQVVNITSGNCDIVINGFDFETITNIFKASGYTCTNIAANGIIGSITDVVDYTSGIVNLFYDAEIGANAKLFSENCPATHYCNVPTVNGSAFRFNSDLSEQSITVYVPALCTIRAIDPCYIHKIEFSSSSAKIYTKYGEYTSGSVLNDVTPVFIENTWDGNNNVALKITTYNRIV